MADAELVHPRDVYTYERGEKVEAAFLDALNRGRLHHAWLLCGPEGVGKASFAYRAARRLLGAAPDEHYGLLGSSPEHTVSRQIAVRSHPDLMVLERVGEDGKARKVIPVDDARKLPEFFSKAPASAPYRVAIVDAVDDMNANAANALLKILEEPPERGVLFLVSHSPGGLLPTIRSRCRRLTFAPWSEAETTAFVERSLDVTEEAAIRLARMAKGSPGRALDLAARHALAADDAAHELLIHLPQVDASAVLALAETFRGPEGFARFELLFERLADQIHNRAMLAAGEGAALSDQWGPVWETLTRLPREVEGLNLDRADALWSTVAQLRAAARA